MSLIVDPLHIDILKKEDYDSITDKQETITTYFLVNVTLQNGSEKFGRDGKKVDGLLYSKKKGSRYVVSHSQVKEMLRPYISYVIFGSVHFSLPWDAAAIQAFGNLTRSNLDRPKPDDNSLRIIVQTKKALKIGINRHTNEYLCYHTLISKTFEPSPMPLTDQKQIVSRVGTYIRAALLFLNDDLYTRMIEDMSPLVDSHEVDIHVLTTEERNSALGGGQIYQDKLLILAFVALSAITKKGSSEQHVREWLQKRLGPLLLSADISDPTLQTANYYHDIKAIADFLENRHGLRRCIYYPFLSADSPPGISHGLAVLRDQLKLVLMDYNMNTFMLCASFARRCNTAAHLIEEVCRQSRALLKVEEDTRKQHEDAQLGYDFSYLCVFQRHPDCFNVNNFPDVVYCAIIEKKRYGDVSWQNYKVANTNTSVDLVALEDGVSRLLHKDPTAGTGGLSPESLGFLADRGVDIGNIRSEVRPQRNIIMTQGQAYLAGQGAYQPQQPANPGRFIM